LPRIYVSATDIVNYPSSIAFTPQVAALQAISGGLDKLLARASKRVDGFCRKRVVSVPATTIATGGGISIGATSVNLTSTLGYDSGQETAIRFNPGGNTDEIVPIAPGGVLVTNWASPYPGTITLAQGTAFAHSAGETVQGIYQEVSTVGSSSSSDSYSDSLISLNQAAQLAQAHAPQFSTVGLTRVIFLKCYPIMSLLKIEHMLPIDTTFQTLDSTNVGIQPASGYLRLPLGSFVLPEGLFRTTYTAGYVNVPDEIAQATALYAADELQNMVSQGSYNQGQGKRHSTWATSSTKSRFVQQAEELLEAGNFKRRT
jgi:hypothetical protein